MTAIFRRIFTAMIAATLLPHGAVAGLIRDAQTEHYLQLLARPVYEAASLSPDHVRMFIVGDPAINAFVAGGSNMFINTGLITEASTPDMVMGVIAHETGHITGGHLLRSHDYMRRAQIGSILTYLLGAAAIAGGAGDAGLAILAGGGHASQRAMLSYSRANEQAADQAALRYVDSLGLSAIGMVDMFERLRREERRYGVDDADQYSRTHPLSKDRIAHMRAHVQQSPHHAQLPDALQREHQLVRAKLIGFINEPANVLSYFPSRDMSDPARVARAVMYSRQSDYVAALKQLDGVSNALQDDAYINELRGYILFHAGKPDAAAQLYAKAVNAQPDSAILRSDYARPLLAIGDEVSLRMAENMLLTSSKADPTYHQTWRLLAKLYGQRNDIAKAELALAELAALTNDKEALTRHLDRAEKLADDATALLRISDLRQFLVQLHKKADDE